MRKVYLPLKKEQKSRGIVYSSTLVEKNGQEFKTHELKEWDEGKISLLKKDSFFAAFCNKNIIRS